MKLSFEPFQVADKVTPWDTWAENMPAVPRLRRGRLYCVEAVATKVHSLQVSFVGVRPDGRCKGFDRFWPAPAFRLVHRAGHPSGHNKEAA